jgi:hypothetical protein
MSLTDYKAGKSNGKTIAVDAYPYIDIDMKEIPILFTGGSKPAKQTMYFVELGIDRAKMHAEYAQ